MLVWFFEGTHSYFSSAVCACAFAYLRLLPCTLSSAVIILGLLPASSPDTIPVAVQPAGEAAPAEMVHAANGAGEEEGDPGHDDAGGGPSAAFLQLSPVEGSEDRLQEVG